jgi:hypothetical protein
MLIDIYTHIFPGRFYEQMSKSTPHLGNIGKRIFNVPGEKFYEPTKIDKPKGENWFYSEHKPRKQDGECRDNAEKILSLVIMRTISRLEIIKKDQRVKTTLLHGPSKTSFLILFNLFSIPISSNWLVCRTKSIHIRRQNFCSWLSFRI